MKALISVGWRFSTVQWRRFSGLAPRSPPLWWQQGWARQRAGSVAEAELLAPLGELLMPGMPVREMFRSFKSPAGWGGNYLEPDLTAYGVLKDEDAALFVEYDGYYRHATKEGMEKDLQKNVALLAFAPADSFVLRIGHTGRCQLDGQVLRVRVNAWRRGDRLSLTRALKTALEETVRALKPALHSSVYRCLEAHVQNQQPMVISRSAEEFREAAVVLGRGNTAEEIANFLKDKGFRPTDIHRMQQQALVKGVSIETTLHPLLQWLFDLRLTKSQVAKAVAKAPQLVGLSIEHNLTPTVQWFIDLGLSKSQVGKVVATHPPIICLSIHQNLNPTVQWFICLGLTKSQIAKAVATSPSIFCYSIPRNLNPTVQWFLDLGFTKNQVAKAAAVFPSVLGYSTEQNLKPTVQWLLDLGLTKSQIAKGAASFPQILGYSIDQNLKPTTKWLLDLGLTKDEVARAVARNPQILGRSIQQNLMLKVRWLLELGLTKGQVAKAVATYPQILGLRIDRNLTPKLELLQSFLTPRGALELISRFPTIFSYRQERLEKRLNILAQQDSLAKLASTITLTDEMFHRRFVDQKRTSASYNQCVMCNGSIFSSRRRVGLSQRLLVAAKFFPYSRWTGTSILPWLVPPQNKVCFAFSCRYSIDFFATLSILLRTSCLHLFARWNILSFCRRRLIANSDAESEETELPSVPRPDKMIPPSCLFLGPNLLFPGVGRPSGPIDDERSVFGLEQNAGCLWFDHMFICTVEWPFNLATSHLWTVGWNLGNDELPPRQHPRLPAGAVEVQEAVVRKSQSRHHSSVELDVVRWYWMSNSSLQRHKADRH